MTTESKSAFARRLGVAPSYVTKLAQAGRLIVIDGQIEVETSLALIEATKDPNRDDVRQRHAQARDVKRQGRPIAIPPAGESKRSAKEAPQPAAQPMLKAASAFREARAEKMHWQARLAAMRLAAKQGKLIPLAAANRAAMEMGVTLRTMMENLPDQLAPRLVHVRDPVIVRRILEEYGNDIDAALNELIERHVATWKQPKAGGDAD